MGYHLSTWSSLAHRGHILCGIQPPPATGHAADSARGNTAGITATIGGFHADKIQPSIIAEVADVVLWPRVPYHDTAAPPALQVCPHATVSAPEWVGPRRRIVDGARAAWAVVNIVVYPALEIAVIGSVPGAALQASHGKGGGITGEIGVHGSSAWLAVGAAIVDAEDNGERTWRKGTMEHGRTGTHYPREFGAELAGHACSYVLALLVDMEECEGLQA